MSWADYCRSRKKGTEQCIRDKDGRIVVWCVGYSYNELKNLLKRHPGWYFSDAKFEYFAEQGLKPIINTYKPVF